MGKGDVTAACGRQSPKLLPDVEAAIDRLVKEKPQLFDLQEEAGAGTGQYRVLDAEGYADGLIADLRAAGLCAERTLDLQRLAVKDSNSFSEEWDLLSSSGFIRRTANAYRSTCDPASFPADPADYTAYVRTAFFSFECNPGVVPPPNPDGLLPLSCDGYVTATPKQRSGLDVPAWIHGPDIRWELREGDDVVNVDEDWRYGNAFNKVLRTKGRTGGFVLCATVLGKVGCLNGRVIP
ncbi:MAG TPA: hypothetical protein VMT70_12860 [Vicinamibacteria bacterium]|nr:hypothetical protein [Vicinamibacteria bacterium]